MVVFFLSVALTNLALGYALALYLHPDADNGALPIPNMQPGARSLPVVDAQERPQSPLTATEVDLPKQSEPARSVATEEVVADNSSKSIVDLATPDPHRVAPQSDRAVEIAATVEPPAESESSIHLQSSTPTESPSGVPLEEAAEETDKSIDCDAANHSFDQFVLHLQDYRAKLAEIQQRIEQCVSQPDSVQVQSCMRDLRALNYSYFEHQLEISDQMARSAIADDTDVRSRINAAVATQSAQISDVDCALIDLDPSADALGCAQQLLGETAKLSRAGDTFADALSAAEGAAV